MTTDTPDTGTYIPGVCNIGPAERAQRKRFGMVSAIGAVLLLVVLIATSAPRPWRLLLFVPVFMAASGILQHAMHFCAGFGFRGVFNVLNAPGETEDVVAAEFRRQDRNKALQITSLAAAIGAVVTALALAI